ncbi:enoyl-CoA hydratase-related protein [Rhodococcus sp. C3V]|uniref:enoyl-CoA hydratase-related protein n=1 Tax=Rhodococcus sp. C3V TaxID=3034165 RepID=UPI0023E0A16D|nr:enoyl-CoA hydratase-related protein [Rhodococcus sp. C3V]MDF3319940.1 enoyl-CoA hydratase-related protein [Rhodococcus sp. C3V]
MEREYETLEVVRKDNGVVIVRLDRAPVNAVNKQMVADLTAVFSQAEYSKEARAIVLSANGDGIFCAGIDLKERRQLNSGELDHPVPGIVVDFGVAWRRATEAIAHCAVPVIAAVDGLAVGAGLMVAQCDIIYASERAAFGLPEINVGLLGGSSVVTRMVGPFKARKMFFTGDPVSAREFYRLGAVEEIVPDGEPERYAVELADKIATKSPIAMRLAKESAVRIDGLPVEDGYRCEQDYTLRLRLFEDSAEAMTAFVERRQPEWQLR